MKPWNYDPSRCSAVVWHRDTYRRTGRTKSGFELHFTRSQCSRKAKADGRCTQHRRDFFPTDY